MTRWNADVARTPDTALLRKPLMRTGRSSFDG
jgi:hypothetical protein